MKEKTLEFRKEAEPSHPQSGTGDLAEAVKSVYKRYGTDLSAFFQDAYKNAERKSREKEDIEVEVCQS